MKVIYFGTLKKVLINEKHHAVLFGMFLTDLTLVDFNENFKCNTKGAINKAEL